MIFDDARMLFCRAARLRCPVCAFASAVRRTSLALIDNRAEPSPRLYFSMVAARNVDAGSDSYLVIFGGELMSGKGRSQRIRYFKDTFVFSVGSKVWAKVDTASCSPSARSGHHAAVVGAGAAQTMYLFGGEFGNAKGTSFTHLNDTWAFDASSRRWTAVNATGDTPSARCNRAAR